MTPRPLNLKLAAGLVAAWAAATALVVVFALPFWLAKLALGLCALAWAAHVIVTVRAKDG